MKAFAQRMVDDHSTAAVKFKEAVLEAKLAMPPDKLDAKHQAIVDELAGKQRGFDKVYIEAQYKAHIETVDLFKGYAQGGEEDARVRGRVAAHPAGPFRPRRQNALRVTRRTDAPSAGYRHCSLTDTGPEHRGQNGSSALPVAAPQP